MRAEARRQRRELYLAHGCAQLDGKGTFSWTPDRDRLGALHGTIAGRSARLAVDPGLGSSLISRRFATELGIAGGPPIDVRGPTGPVTGAPATVELQIGGARARDVAVAVVDALPEDLDGVIGLDFLWRFEITDDRGRLRAAPPRR
ncbi:MAG: retropepsin-like aspartic protease [Kofleriaceae bacterium]